MTADMEALVAEREADIARLRELYRFSASEAADFIERFGVDKPVDSIHVKQAEAA